MLEAIATQMENNRRKQEQCRKDFYRYSALAHRAKGQLMQLTKEQIHLKMWGCINAKLQNENAVDESGWKRTQQGDEKAIGTVSEKGEKGS